VSGAAEDYRPAGDETPRAWRHLTILETLDEDAAAAVYRARERARQDDVVLKLQWPAASASLAAKAVEDARLKMRVRDPNVAAVYGAAEADGRVGVWTEFVKGETLAGLLKSNGPFDPRDAARIGLALCRALSAVHDAGFHGDVRAHKVMRVHGGGGKDRIVLLDFGIEPTLDAHASSLLYQPPETFAGRPATPGADIYGLGVLLFHLVTDTYPVSGDTFDEIRRAHEAATRRTLNEVRASLPRAFAHAVEHSIAPNPLDRYQTLGALELTLARYIGPGKRRYDWLNLPWPRVAAAVLVVAVAAAAVIASSRVRLRQDSATTSSSRAIEVDAGAASAGSAFGATPFTIGAALYRESGSRGQLRALADLSPGDEWSIEVTASVPMHVYVVAENERGEANLLIPPAGRATVGPIPAATATRLPGGRAGGSREYVLVVASPEPLPALEETMPPSDPPQGERARLSAASMEWLRTLPTTGVPGAAPGPASLASRFPTPLPEDSETVRGVWVRQITMR
jgi:eukaryotic-like serine/threonine-protein kinase